MTTTDTLPVPRPPLTPPSHEHAWATESRHRTSDGVVSYVMCVACRARRVDLQEFPPTPPAPVTRSISSR